MHMPKTHCAVHKLNQHSKEVSERVASSAHHICESTLTLPVERPSRLPSNVGPRRSQAAARSRTSTTPLAFAFGSDKRHPDRSRDMSPVGKKSERGTNRVGRAEKRLNAEQDGPDLQCWAPFIFQDVQADS